MSKLVATPRHQDQEKSGLDKFMFAAARVVHDSRELHEARTGTMG
jgi:hypothetical protein